MCQRRQAPPCRTIKCEQKISIFYTALQKPLRPFTSKRIIYYYRRLPTFIHYTGVKKGHKKESMNRAEVSIVELGGSWTDWLLQGPAFVWRENSQNFQPLGRRRCTESHHWMTWKTTNQFCECSFFLSKLETKRLFECYIIKFGAWRDPFYIYKHFYFFCIFSQNLIFLNDFLYKKS